MLLSSLLKAFSPLMSSCHVTTFSVFELWFFDLIIGGILDLPPFSRVGFWQIYLRIVNKYRVSNENFSRQCIKSNHANKTNCTNAFEMTNIKEAIDECQGKRSLYLFLLGETEITVTVQWTLKVTHTNKLQVLSRLSPLANVFSFFRVYFSFCLPSD